MEKSNGNFFLQSVNLFPDDLHLLFGEDCQVMEAFSQVDRDNDGEVLYKTTDLR